jgi:hypothetical protein
MLNARHFFFSLQWSLASRTQLQRNAEGQHLKQKKWQQRP